MYDNFFIYKSNQGAYLLLKSIFLLVFSIPFIFVITPLIAITYILLFLKVLCDLAWGFLFVVSLALNIASIILGMVVSIICMIFLIPDYIYAAEEIKTYK